MKLSKTASLAALAMVHLASRRSEGFIQARQVAEYLSIPTDSALKVLQALSRHNVISSQLGRSGGYRVDAEPREITLRQIVEAIDGPIEGEIPVRGYDNGLSEAVVELRKAANRVAHRVRHELERTTVADLLADDGEQVLATIEGGIAH